MQKFSEDLQKRGFKKWRNMKLRGMNGIALKFKEFKASANG